MQKNIVYIETYGCQMNVADTEIVLGILKKQGYDVTDKPDNADVILLNTCSIRDNAEQRIYGRIGNLKTLKYKKPGLVLGILGCMAERLRKDLIEDKKVVDLVVGPDEYRRLPEYIDVAFNGDKGIGVKLSRTETYDDIEPHREDGLLYMGGYWHGSTAANQTAFFDNVSVSVGVNIATPIISLSKSYLSGFNYAQGSGPSAEQSFNISGRNLEGDILIAPPSDYEISTGTGGSFAASNPITLSQISGNVNSTTIYVRLKAGLTTGVFNNETITAVSSGAVDKTVICNGLVTSALPPSLPLVEDFNYAGGGLLTSNGWVAHSAAGINPITVINTGLSYDNYPSSGIGNSVNIVENGEDVNRGFAEQSLNGSTIYFSFLINVTEAQSDIPGEYFLHLGDRLTATSFSFFSARVFARVGASNIVNFGLSNTSTPQWIATNYSKNTIYLIIVKYTINTSDNDEVKMWVRPSGVPLDEASAGPADITITTEPGQDVIDAIGIRQAADIPDLVIDGIRIATNWANAPLPVELSSFSAFVIGSGVKLSWETETEVNNYGFEVLRQAHTSTSLSVTGWEKIGFINGNGNSNSPKNYSFVDHNVNTGKYSYRLKQIDNDGQFDYSKAIEVDLGAPKKFELSQNYPNPFNPTTKIRYTIPTTPSSSHLVKGRSEVGFVSLKVYDILGNEIVTLVNEEKPAGIYEVEFNSTGVASGIYFYKLQSGSFVQTRKMLVLK